MIDLHNHLLPGLDDGPNDWSETLNMCRMAYSDGIRVIAATPHINSRYTISKKDILDKVKYLEGLLKKEDIKLKLIPAADVRLDAALFDLLDNDELITLGGKKRYLLLEIPPFDVPQYIKRFVFELQLKGVIPIITHPERNAAIKKNHELLQELVDLGALVQVTAMSLTNGFGSMTRGCIKKLLRSDMVHLLATDAHSIKKRPPLLSSAVKAAAKIVGRQKAQALVTTNPQAIIDGWII